MTYFLRAGIFLLLALGPVNAWAADRAIVVLDASGSMWGQIGGEAKIAIARKTLTSVLGSLPDTLELGLMAYGHRDKGSCDDIELIVPPAAGTGPAIAAAANALTPKGKTPISAAVKLAAEDLKYTEEKATVILITDGLETCDADPCAVASALEAAGVDLTVHVVGFGLSSAEGAEVACLAENTGGQYFAADNAAALGDALSQTVAQTVAPPPPPPPPPRPAEEPTVEKNLAVTSRPAPDAPPFTGEDGIAYQAFAATAEGRAEDPVTTEYGADGSRARFQLPTGSYVIVASKDLARAETKVDVTEGKLTTADIVLNSGIVKARAMATETEPEPSDGVSWVVTDISGEHDTSYGPTRTITVNAGDVSVAASLGSASTTVPATVAAGQTVAMDVVLGAGHLVLRGKRSAEATDFDQNVRFDVTNAGGETFTAYGEAKFDMPAGDYTVKASLGEATAELKVSIVAGKTTAEDIVVATGKIVVHALFAEGGPAVTAGPRFDVLSPEPGTDGQRKVIATAYDDGAAFDLPPGKYVLRASSDAATVEAGIEVKAGAPVEISVVLNAGLLALTAPGGDRLDVLSAKKDIYGKQADIATNYGESWQIALPAGDYIVKVSKPDGSEKTAPTTIKAGERTELTVE